MVDEDWLDVVFENVWYDSMEVMAYARGFLRTVQHELSHPSRC